MGKLSKNHFTSPSSEGLMYVAAWNITGSPDQSSRNSGNKGNKFQLGRPPMRANFVAIRQKV